MTFDPIQILLVEDDPEDALLLRETLRDAGAGAHKLVQCDRLTEAIDQLAAARVDLILTDLSLPDSQGLDTFTRLHERAGDVPIIVLTGFDDEAAAIRAVKDGAQDYLVKGQVHGRALLRSIRYAVERHAARLALHDLALRDDLTGLYNRRGFFALAEQHQKLAHRQHKPFLVLYADLDGLKRINDTFGHHEGSRAIVEAAGVLKATLRASDILARLGGDEFVALAIDAGEDDEQTVAARLQANMDRRNAQLALPYRLEMSIGIMHWDPAGPIPLEEAIVRADQGMYLRKRGKGRAREQNAES
jgi:diguanylate cyclase (GGDEF)-like protein